MPTPDIEFSRKLLIEAHDLVRKHFPQIKMVHTVGWTYKHSKRGWEWHGPDQFYWHGKADNGYHARYLGWMAWLKHKGVTV